ncbi:MAG: hypothetical protein WC564_00245 [Patescibacteria group bacterium]|jgi:hypothetical protein
MKKYICIIVIIFTSFQLRSETLVPDTTAKNDAAVNQPKSELIWVRESDIPPAALKNLESDYKILDVESDLEKIGQYVSIGKEIGGAIDTSLGAIAYQADNISKTFVGKFTMVMIAWKLVGKDFKDKVIDVFALVLFIIFWSWSFRRNFARRRVPIKVKLTPWVPWFKKFRRRKVLESELFEFDFDDADDEGKTSYIAHLVVGIIVVIIMSLITTLG